MAHHLAGLPAPSRLQLTSPRQQPGESTLTPLQQHFLGRLRELEELHCRLEDSTGTDAFLMSVVHRGVFASYLDCVRHGIGEEGRTILAEYKLPDARRFSSS